MKISVSVVKGKGSIAHNNREFSTPNVDRSLTPNNVIYKQEPLAVAYQECFGEAVMQYNQLQKRTDRKIANYLDSVKLSKNGEKLFYENVVQVGNKFDMGIGTANAKLAKMVLDEYMRGFQRANPNLYVFNAVLHVDEPTVHLTCILTISHWLKGIKGDCRSGTALIRR